MKKHLGERFAHVVKTTNIHLVQIVVNIQIQMTAKNLTISCQRFLDLSFSPTEQHVFKISKRLEYKVMQIALQNKVFIQLNGNKLPNERP